MTSLHEREIGKELTGALNHSTGSYELVVAAIAAAGFGYLIDRAFGIVPVFTLVFAMMGFVGAGYTLYLQYTKDMNAVSTDRTARVAGVETADETTASLETDA